MQIYEFLDDFNCKQFGFRKVAIKEQMEQHSIKNLTPKL
jgi:hypothetical protein